VEKAMSEMVSFGAGVNSVAMTIMLVNDGWRGPIVFADTGGEWPETYCYLRTFEDEWLRPRGLEVTRVSVETHPELYKDKRLTGDINTLEAFSLSRGIVPILASRWCTVMFKRDPLVNWRMAHNLDMTCLGISASEPRRVRDDPNVRYPLYEEGITRGGCRRIIQAEGLEQPIKSGCFFCPGQRLDNWRRLYYEHPDLYERAALMEETASAHCQKWATLDPHQISLREHARRRWKGQTMMDLSEWLPCLCTL
jgi:hypothetical protein